MRKPEKVRFELRTNKNLSRQNLQRAYGSLGVKEPEIVNDVPVIGALIRGLKCIVRKCIRWYVTVQCGCAECHSPPSKGYASGHSLPPCWQRRSSRADF